MLQTQNCGRNTLASTDETRSLNGVMFLKFQTTPETLVDTNYFCAVCHNMCLRAECAVALFPREIIYMPH